MSERSGHAFRTFIDRFKHEARPENAGETMRARVLRMLSEAHEDIDNGIRTRGEAAGVLAKVDIALEQAQGLRIKHLIEEALSLRADITERYPDIPE